eukprot:CAMPEP_0178455878 /NCGR_PEP_ID=MMETSP0689_2-20121128/46148_1 /TAXON_ID=160604 /ORGANISM="Amphidinium massartii, Strain CS-259" /LENGTH=84 /DNA_ID=CAMNT_0020081951 /DNA_START=18 /DNA_END=268 /DNA_ORIENTATION=+
MLSRLSNHRQAVGDSVPSSINAVRLDEHFASALTGQALHMELVERPFFTGSTLLHLPYKHGTSGGCCNISLKQPTHMLNNPLAS